MDLELVNFDNPREVRTFEKGRFELYEVGPMTLGRASYEPGWRWSEHVGPASGEASCQVEHVGLVLSGQAVAKMDDGREFVTREGDFFYVPPDTTAGSSVMNPTSRCTSSAARVTLPRSHRALVLAPDCAARRRGAEHPRPTSMTPRRCERSGHS